MHINLDDLLEIPAGRVCTRERTAEALKQCFTMLGSALARANEKTTVYVMIGAQASGKTTWARAKTAQDPDAIVFDFIRVKKRNENRSHSCSCGRCAGCCCVA